MLSTEAAIRDDDELRVADHRRATGRGIDLASEELVQGIGIEGSGLTSLNIEATPSGVKRGFELF